MLLMGLENNRGNKAVLGTKNDQGIMKCKQWLHILFPIAGTRTLEQRDLESTNVLILEIGSPTLFEAREFNMYVPVRRVFFYLLSFGHTFQPGCVAFMTLFSAPAT